MQLKVGGKLHPRLNIGKRPIANKYREGKMKSTLKRELKAREIVKRETIGVSIAARQVTVVVVGDCGMARLQVEGGASLRRINTRVRAAAATWVAVSALCDRSSVYELPWLPNDPS